MLKFILIWFPVFAVLYLALSAAHLLGHFLAAMIFKAPLDTATFGIGPRLFPLWRTTNSKGSMLIPLIFCEQLTFPRSPSAPGTEAEAESVRLFLRRCLVLTGGPLINLLLGIILMSLPSAAGTPFYLPIIGEVEPESPAAEAGVQAGDRVVALNAQPVDTWEEMRRIIGNSEGGQLEMQIARSDKVVNLTVQPELTTTRDLFGDTVTRPMVGIQADGAFEVRKEPVWRWPLHGVKRTYQYIRGVIGFWTTMPRQFKEEILGGPVMIVQAVGKQTPERLWFFLYTAAGISVTYAFVALLPLPICDGGHLIYLIIETRRGRQINPRTRKILRWFSIVVMFAIGLIGSLEDIQRILAN